MATTRVTQVQTSTSGDATDVATVTIRRLSGYDELSRKRPPFSDLPEDMRDALRQWVEGSE